MCKGKRRRRRYTCIILRAILHTSFSHSNSCISFPSFFPAKRRRADEGQLFLRPSYNLLIESAALPMELSSWKVGYYIKLFLLFLYCVPPVQKMNIWSWVGLYFIPYLQHFITSKKNIHSSNLEYCKSVPCPFYTHCSNPPSFVHKFNFRNLQSCEFFLSQFDRIFSIWNTKKKFEFLPGNWTKSALWVQF